MNYSNQIVELGIVSLVERNVAGNEKLENLFVDFILGILFPGVGQEL